MKLRMNNNYVRVEHRRIYIIHYLDMYKLLYLIYPLAIPHWIAYKMSPSASRHLIDTDVAEMQRRCKLPNKGLLYWLVFQKPYRNLLYYRIPDSRLLRFLLPKYPLFAISSKEGIGGQLSF